jgi:beta-glucosidase-like glycosyl hydrolase
VLFPHDIGMGATHNPELSYQQGVITAQEGRSTGPQWFHHHLVGRDICWGRLRVLAKIPTVNLRNHHRGLSGS